MAGNKGIQAVVSMEQFNRVLFLAKNDFKAKFAGSYLGILWAFVQPVMSVLVYWFVFEVGFRAGASTGYPFVLYLVTGIVPWFFFSDALSGGTNALLEYDYLVKKVVFKIEILPFVKVISALFVHLFFIVFTVLLLCLYGYYPHAAFVQIFYYLCCNIVLVLGLSYLCSAVCVFFRDLKQIINIIVLQLGMWMTPIMWDAKSMLADHPTILNLIKLNPMYYIADGFRDAMLFGRFAIGEKLLWTLYFWGFAVAVMGIGLYVFKRTKVHFADVL